MSNKVRDTFFDLDTDQYKVIDNPNNSKDKSLCVLVQDASPFDGAVIKYTNFKLEEQELGEDTLGCTYEYDIEVPPHDLGHEITEQEGDEFERRLGVWVIEILQKQMDRMTNATKD